MTDIAERLARAGFVLTGVDHETGAVVTVVSQDGWFRLPPAPPPRQTTRRG
jgi:hypothetical protein